MRREPADGHRETAAYYDRLGRWNRAARWFGYGGGHETLTVHRALADPRAGGRPTATRLHDLIVESLPSSTVTNALDAGCGLGGTMLDLERRLGGRWTGLTLSPAQALRGTAAATAAGQSHRVTVRVQSYDDPPQESFDLIIAIESLAHSPDPGASVATLARRLPPGGALVVVDDMPGEGAESAGAADLATFRHGWRCPVLFSAAQYREAFLNCGLLIVTDQDLTAMLRPRSAAWIGSLMWVNRLAARLIPRASWRMVMDSHHGGLALERLYLAGHMSYRLLIAGRPSRHDPTAEGGDWRRERGERYSRNRDADAEPRPSQ